MKEEAKNKAIELVDKMNAKLPKITMGVIAQDNISKQCALIAVDEILFLLKEDIRPTNIYQQKSFWQEVKNQIKSI